MTIDKQLYFNSTAVQSPHMPSTGIKAEVVVLGISQSKYFWMDEIASHIWSLLATPMKVVTLFSILEQEYDMDPSQGKIDLIEFLLLLEEKKLIVFTNE